jgi:catechol 2,3-dioxygenase-like lactoylglutathione lyase family enzyme
MSLKSKSEICNLHSAISSFVIVLLLLAMPRTASAQLTAAKDGPIVYGHHHLNVSNLDEQKKFWTLLGGTIVKVGTSPAEVVKFPNVLIFMTSRAPSGGTKGTSVNHIGFGVPNIRAMVDKVKAAGYPIVTRAELPPTQEVKDDLAYIADQQNNVAFVMGPDETKVEFLEVKGLATPIAMHHIHFASPQVDEMKAWYVKVFGAKPGMRGSFQAADLPGVNLTYSPAPAGVVGTQGRALDHIGFEVKDLERFCTKLEGMGIKLERPYTKVPALNISIAFIRDPWGTYIELTDGLAAVN